MIRRPPLHLCLVALCSALVIAGCASAPVVPPDQDFTLAVGDRMSVADATVRYAGIASDSRCPPGVQCIRAGDADVLLDVAVGGAAPSRIVLNTGRRTVADARNWRLRLVDLAPGPAPAATLRLETAGRGTAPR